ncbi:hypothetical protein SVIOM74S_01958 [Streptomyces violarus]
MRLRLRSRRLGLRLRLGLGAQSPCPAALALDGLGGRLVGQVVVDVTAPAGQGQDDEDDAEEPLHPQPCRVRERVVVGDVQPAAGGGSKPWAQPSTVVRVSGLPSRVAVPALGGGVGQAQDAAVGARLDVRVDLDGPGRHGPGLAAPRRTFPAADFSPDTMVARATSWSTRHSPLPSCWLSLLRPGVASRTRVTSRGAPLCTST